jgi:hypothetical protein
MQEINAMLDKLLRYHEPIEDGDFARQLVRRVQRQKRQRQWILAITGVIGASFGALGFAYLAEPIGQLFEESGMLPLSLGTMAVVAFVFWLLQDEADAVG